MNRGEAERGVRKLTDDEVSRAHKFFYVVCDCGENLGRTHLSHGARGEDIGRQREADMAHQLGVSTGFFRDIVGCTKDRADYLAVRGHQHP